MAHRVIKDQTDLDGFIRLMGGMAFPFTVEWQPGFDRSLEQNRLQFLWAWEAAEQRGDMTPEEIRCEWKLVHGVPIMREGNPRASTPAHYAILVKQIADEIVGRAAFLDDRTATSHKDE